MIKVVDNLDFQIVTALYARSLRFIKLAVGKK